MTIYNVTKVDEDVTEVTISNEVDYEVTVVGDTVIFEGIGAEHINDTSIHFAQENISITTSQISDFPDIPEDLSDYLKDGDTINCGIFQP